MSIKINFEMKFFVPMISEDLENDELPNRFVVLKGFLNKWIHKISCQLPLKNFTRFPCHLFFLLWNVMWKNTRKKLRKKNYLILNLVKTTRYLQLMPQGGEKMFSCEYLLKGKAMFPDCASFDNREKLKLRKQDSSWNLRCNLNLWQPNDGEWKTR